MDQNYYDTIEILMNETVDYRKIAVELAKVNPLLFVQLHRSKPEGKVEPWMNDVLTHIKDNHKVEAIKTLRNATGMGLKEAKDVVDNVVANVERAFNLVPSVPSYAAASLEYLQKDYYQDYVDLNSYAMRFNWN